MEYSMGNKGGDRFWGFTGVFPAHTAVFPGCTGVFPACTGAMGRVGSKPFPKEAVGLGRDCPPGPARLGTSDLWHHPLCIHRSRHIIYEKRFSPLSSSRGRCRFTAILLCVGGEGGLCVLGKVFRILGTASTQFTSRKVL